MPCPRPPLRPLSLALAAALACNGDSIIAPRTGTLRVFTSTTGIPVDRAAYTLQVDAGPAQAFGGASVMEVVSGNHTVQLGGLASNCGVEGENPRAVTVLAGETVIVNFEVACRTTTGTIQITASTSGGFPDQDGYLVTIDDQVQRGLKVDGTQRLDNLTVGTHLVKLGGVAGNCVVQGTSLRSVEVSAGATSTVSFITDCSATPPIAFSSNGIPGLTGTIYVVNPDGSNLTKLTVDDADEQRPVWSPDRSKLAVLRDQDLYVMSADAKSRTRLTEDLAGVGEFQPGDGFLGEFRWSPDGRAIAAEISIFFDCASVRLCIQRQIWIVQADGSGRRKLANGINPSWSPDGRNIVYSNVQIYTINSDGTGRIKLTNQPFNTFEPAWSPDGARIAFATFVNSDNRSEIFVVNPDGTGLVNLTQGRGYDRRPVWSPDGGRIAFNTYGTPGNPPDYEVAAVNRDGTNRINISNDPGGDYNPTWSPDGSQLAFARDELLDTEIIVVNADGSGQTDVSNFLSAPDTDPTWSSR